MTHRRLSGLIERLRAQFRTDPPRARSRLVNVLFALFLLSLVLRPVSRACSDRLAVAMSAAMPEGVSIVARRSRCDVEDPWGHRMVAVLRPNAAPTLYHYDLHSVGPDGVDDLGGGDDIVPSRLERRAGYLIALAPMGLLALTWWACWLLIMPFTILPRLEEGLAAEDLVLALLAALPSFFSLPFFIYWLTGRELTDSIGRLGQMSPLPSGDVAFGAYLFGSSFLITYILALALRSSRWAAPETAPEAAEPIAGRG